MDDLRRNPAEYLKKLTKTYSQRLAAERMAEEPRTSTELAHEGFEVAMERIKELTAEVERLNARIEELENAQRDE